MSKSAFVDGIIDLILADTSPVLPAEQHLVDQFDAAIERADPTTPASQRYFIDSLTLTGEIYLVPSDRRADWDAFDHRCEETHELLEVPSWARAVEQLSWVEFEEPKEIFK